MTTSKIVLNSKGQPMKLNEQEARHVEATARKLENEGTGYQVDITTMTYIVKRVTEQKFYQIAPAKYLPVRVGQGAWSNQILTYRSFSTGGDFEEGFVNQGSNNSRLAESSAAIDSVTVKVKNWAKQHGWTVMELAEASRSGSWDLVTALEKSRKMNWDLGIQRVAFLGAQADANIKGLYTQVGVTTNTSLITKAINTMSATELSAFCQAVIGAYRQNAQYTAWPTHFIIPESDYTGLAAPSSPDFPLKSKLELLIETFRTITMNPDFQILPNSYGMSAQNGLGVNKYILLNYDEESIRMDIPVDYTSTLMNTVNGFQFQNVGFGTFTGVMAYRPSELFYMQY